MSCCRDSTIKELQAIQGQLEAKGEREISARFDEIIQSLQADQMTLPEPLPLRETLAAAQELGLLEKNAKGEGKSKHLNGPAALDKYYEKCKESSTAKAKADPKQYCARVAWSIYCAYKNPSYKGCTEYGKSWGKPYSGPISK